MIRGNNEFIYTILKIIRSKNGIIKESIVEYIKPENSEERLLNSAKVNSEFEMKKSNQIRLIFGQPGGGYKRYDVIDFLKGFSIFTIILYHLLIRISFPEIIRKALRFGGTGVHVFIFSSGFGLYLSYLRKPQKYTKFIGRRFLRIYVPYVFVIFLSCFIPYMYEDTDIILAFLSHAFLYKMFIEKYYQSFGPFWFISTIFQFYILFIPLCKFRKLLSSKSSFFIFSIVVSTIWWVLSTVSGIRKQLIWSDFFLQYLWEFVLGMILAEHLYEGNTVSFDRWKLFAVAIVCLGVAVLLSNNSKFKAFNDIPAFVGYASFALFLYSFGIFNKIFIVSSRFSYELYLTHSLVFGLFILAGNKYSLLGQGIRAIFAFATAYIIAYCYMKLIQLVGKACSYLAVKM